jgi:putative redox protein
MSKSTMKFAITGEAKGMQTIVKTGEHQLTIDEPENMGGTDTGADPLSSLLGTLAGCENVIAHFVAKEMDFNLDGISFDIKGELDSRGLMGDQEVRPYFEKVQIEARVQTNESEERIKELQEKTDQRCPVYTMMKAAGVKLEAKWIRD